MTDADKPAFLQALARLAVALREPAPDVVLLQVYFTALKDCEVEFLVMAADQLMLEAKWFPKTSEWRDAAMKVEADRAAAMREAMRKSSVRLCLACEDTGWERRGGRVHRCDCQRLRRLELLGRRPWPALPAASVPDGEISQAEAVSLRKMIEHQTGVTFTPRDMPV